ncbi:MAG: hypothetical protein V7744_14970 [Pseudomonadales bacterium]
MRKSIFVITFIVAVGGIFKFLYYDNVRIESLIGLPETDEKIKTVMSKQGGRVEVSDYEVEILGRFRYYKYNGDGIEFLFVKGYLNTIFIYSIREDNNPSYKGSLPKGLMINDNKEVIIRKLGYPDESGGNVESKSFPGTMVPAFDVWKYDHFSLHISYNDNGDLTKLSIADIIDMDY